MPFHYFLVLVLVSLLWCWICFPFSWWWLHASWLTVNARWLSINAGWMWINIRCLSIQFDCLIIINKWLRFYTRRSGCGWNIEICCIEFWLYFILRIRRSIFVGLKNGVLTQSSEENSAFEELLDDEESLESSFSESHELLLESLGPTTFLVIISEPSSSSNDRSGWLSGMEFVSKESLHSGFG